ncbi:MAG: hypothetical protein P8Z37_06325 [Acidobacteriota bacterium]|jgi:hypothetical protein
MNCQNFKNAIEASKDGRLPGDILQEIREHIRCCDACRTGLDARDLVEILPAMDQWIEPSKDFSSRFYSELNSRRNKNDLVEVSAKDRGLRPSWLSAQILRLAAAGVILVLVTAGFYFRDRSPEVDTSAVLYEIEVTEELNFFQDMVLLEDLDFFEDLDAIENMPRSN